MKILLIEDDQQVASFVRRGLEENGMSVSQAFDGLTGLQLARDEQFDVIILDVIMPALNGMEVCERLRTEYQTKTPLLMLTALGATDDIVTGLARGADDYVTKPFKMKELVARIGALNRRKTQISKILKVHDLVLNTETKEVYRGDKKVDLTATEYRLLEFLLQNKNRVVFRTEILENVWDVNHDTRTNLVDVYVNYLRKKVDGQANSQLIKTIIGMGYTIKDADLEGKP